MCLPPAHATSLRALISPPYPFVKHQAAGAWGCFHMFRSVWQHRFPTQIHPWCPSRVTWLQDLLKISCNILFLSRSLSQKALTGISLSPRAGSQFWDGCLFRKWFPSSSLPALALLAWVLHCVLQCKHTSLPAEEEADLKPRETNCSQAEWDTENKQIVYVPKSAWIYRFCSPDYPGLTKDSSRCFFQHPVNEAGTQSADLKPRKKLGIGIKCRAMQCCPELKFCYWLDDSYMSFQD